MLPHPATPGPFGPRAASFRTVMFAERPNKKGPIRPAPHPAALGGLPAQINGGQRQEAMRPHRASRSRRTGGGTNSPRSSARIAGGRPLYSPAIDARSLEDRGQIVVVGWRVPNVGPFPTSAESRFEGMQDIGLKPTFACK
jgi:hypothetical protein